MQIFDKNITYDHKTITYAKNSPHFSMKHSHISYEIIFFERGDANYVMENKNYELHPYDLIFTTPLTYHFIEIKSNVEYTRYNITFDESFVSKQFIDKFPKDIDVINCKNNPIICEIFKKMRYYSNHLEKEQFKMILQHLLIEIFVNFSINIDNTVSVPHEISPIITRSLEYINQNLLSPITLEDICRHLGLSVPYFCKLFKMQLKITPKQYINTKRINYAQQLLSIGYHATEIFSTCGFDSYVGFYKAYTKAFGYPPSQEGKH